MAHCEGARCKKLSSGFSNELTPHISDVDTFLIARWSFPQRAKADSGPSSKMIKAVSRVLFITVAIFANAHSAFAQSAASKHVQVTVTAKTTSASEREWSGAVRLVVAPGWHIYAEAAGTAGIATSLDWKLENGWHAVHTEWPKPTEQVHGRDTTYEYTGTISVPIKLQADRGAAAATQSLKVSYGVCRNICIPESVTLKVRTARR